MPWVIPFVLVVLVAQSFLLARTRLGRYMYAIGASPEAARRAGIHVARIRTIAFALCSFTAGLAAVVYASRLGSITIGFDGGTYVLYAVAAAVIGGASLFGGYGKPIHPLLGGLVIATLTNGLALLNITTAGTDVATAAVLLVAVAVDATLRRRGRPGAEADAAAAHGANAGWRSTGATAALHRGRPRTDRRRGGRTFVGRLDTTTEATTTTVPLRSAATPSWTVYHGDPAGSGVAASVASVDLSSPAWTSPALDGQLYGEPLVSGGTGLRRHGERHGVRAVGDDGRGGVVDARRHAGAISGRCPAATSPPPSASPARR